MAIPLNANARSAPSGSRGSRRGARGFAALPLVLSSLAPPVLPADPAVQIHEVLAGVNGNSRVQFVVLRFAAGEAWGPGAGETAGRALLEFHDAAGAAMETFVFPSGPPAGAPDAEGLHSVLIATQAFADLDGAPAPDYLLPLGLLVPGGGKVCFRPNPASPGLAVNLCLSYGAFAGPTETDTGAPPEPAGPPAAALPITGVRTLRRFRNFTADFLGKKQRNADFRLGAPEGRRSGGETFSLAEATAIEQGRTLFFQETFLGNGRTCGTCHAAGEAFGLSPQAISNLGPDDPLFVFETVEALRELEDGVLLRGPSGLILENIDGFDQPHVFRGSPALLNLARTAPFGLSGEIATLAEFSTTAVKQHLPRTLARNADPAAAPMDFRLPTEEELAHLESFMRSLALDLDLDLMIASAVFRGAAAGTVRRGRDLFFGDARCFKCHSGPALADVDSSLIAEGIVPGPGNHRFNTGVAARGAANGFPGSHELAREFDTRPLVGVALRKAFFHDHSATALKDAVDFYCTDCDENFFVRSPAAKQIGAFSFALNEDRLAVTAFLEALIAPAPECASGFDCDGNGIADACEIAAFVERDCDLNGTPDACESDTIDCDENGIADECDLAMSPARDCNDNAIPDACEIAAGSSRDCNGNAFPDECERGGLLDASEPSLFRPGLAASIAGGRPQGAPPFALAAAGDVNADGVDDLLIGARPGEAEGDFDLPAAYVLFGGDGFGSAGPTDLSTLDGAAGFRLTGFSPRFSSEGFAVAPAGDFNRDGAADFIIGDSDAGPGGRSGAGAAYIVFGRHDVGGAGAFAIETLDGANGFILEGAKAVDRLGSSVAGGGDLNGDGAPDVAIGAPFADPGRNAAGEAYVIFGGTPPPAARLAPAALDGATGFVIQGGRELDFAGSAVAFAGDVNGDGVDDLLVGAEGADPGGRESAGETYVIFGGAAVGTGGILRLASLEREKGFVIRGASALDTNLHIAVAAAGDVNADGFADVLVGAPAADPDGRAEAGEAYVVFGGPAAGASGAIELSGLAGDAGFVMRGREAGDRLGATLASLGDMNGDGIGDFAVGTGGGREVHVIHGSPAIGSSGAVDVHAPAAGAGVAIQLRAAAEVLPDAFIANTVAAAGDLNADGVPDLGLGLRLPSSGPSAAPGRMFILFGPLYPADCDGSGIPDSCEVAGGSAVDANGNGVPDRCEPPVPARFRRGDVDADGVFNITDPIVTLNCLFQGVLCPGCLDASDANDDGAVNITDPIFSLGCQFLGSRCPPEPFERCGPDPTVDEVPCAAPHRCP